MSVVVALSLLHFIWEGALIGGAAWIGMKAARTASARYSIGVVALAVMAAAPIATATWIRDSVVQGPASKVQGQSWVQGPDESGVQGPESRVKEPMQAVSNPGPKNSGLTLDSGRWTLDYIRQSVSVRVSPSVAKLLLSSWLLGVGLLSVRLSLGLWTARRLTRLSVREPRLEILSNAERLMAKLNIRGAVTVLESALVKVPTAMGWLKPVVLLPAQAMTGLSIAQIDALVAHELAHIKRHDYLVNLLQSAIETLLFYHPAVWIISRSVRHERELCCDDLAIAACGDDRLTYASALADLESLRQEPEPMLAANGGSLLTRVRRILAPDDVQTVRGTGHWLAGVAILLTVLIGAATQSVQGRQIVQGVASGVVNSIANGVKGGVTGGITGAVSGGVIGAVNGAIQDGVVGGVKDGLSGGAQDGVAGGVVGGVDGNVLGAVDAPDQQKIAIGQIVRLEVTVTPANAKLTARQVDMLIATAYSDWVRAQEAAARAKAEADRLAEVLRTPDIIVSAASTVPGLSTDSVVVAYMNRLEEQDKSRKQLKAVYGYGDRHPNIVQIDSEVASIRHQLVARMHSLVDVARLNSESARDTAERAKASYDALNANPSRGVAASTRDSNLSKDYTVQEDGTILLPYAGSVKAAGLTLVALQESARVALRAQGQRIVKVLASIEARAADAVPSPAPVSPTQQQPVKETPNPPAFVAPPPPARPVAPAPVGSGLAQAQPPKQVSGYVIGANDVLRIRVYSGGQPQPDFRTTDFTVQTDGTVALPLIRPVKIAGLPVEAANEAIRRALLEGAIFNEAQVDVVVMGYHSSRLKVQGAVNKPGSVDMTAERMNLQDLLNAAGGLQPVAGSQIRIRRANGRPAEPSVLVRDGWEIYPRSDLESGRLNAVQLYDNDTVDVPVAPKFYVQGFVVNPGEAQWEPNLTLERALFKVGGVTKDGAGNRITVRRTDPKTKQAQTIKLAADKMSTIIEAGDVITVPKKLM